MFLNLIKEDVRYSKVVPKQGLKWPGETILQMGILRRSMHFTGAHCRNRGDGICIFWAESSLKVRLDVQY